MLNNKGFVVSTILYTLLIAFLLFLGVLLSTFSSSTDIISNANSDLVNGNALRANQFIEKYSIKDLSDYNSDSDSSAYYNLFYNSSDPFKCISANSSDVGYKWYQKYEKDSNGKINPGGLKKLVPINSNILVKINSRYGTLYWPRDFTNGSNGNIVITCESNVDGIVGENCVVQDLSKLKDKVYTETINGEQVEKIEIAKIDMVIEDISKNQEIKIVVGDICR